MPREPRYIDTGKRSFFGDMVYERVIPQDHFLVALEELFSWEEMSAELIRAYRGRGVVGRRPYDPVQVFKMLFISYLYGVSERQVEEMVNFHLVVKWFVGLAVDEAAPDHSTLTRFKDRYLQEGQWALLQQTFTGIITQARDLGLEMGTLQVVDSTHTQSDVNSDKDDKRQKRGQPPRDREAAVVNKGRREVVEPDGRRVKKLLRYLGYKTHDALNARTGIVTGFICTSGNAADNKQFPDLQAQDQALGLPIEAYGGDAAYDDTDIYARLEAHQLRSAICLRKFRTEKKDANKEPWLRLVASARYQEEKAQRYRVEQPFGPAKQKHGFGRCRYLGLARYRLQALFTLLVGNCKRIVKLLTGITFRPQAKGRRAEVFKAVFAQLPWA